MTKYGAIPDTSAPTGHPMSSKSELKRFQAQERPSPSTDEFFKVIPDMIDIINYVRSLEWENHDLQSQNLTLKMECQSRQQAQFDANGYISK